MISTNNFIESISCYHISLPLKKPFKLSCKTLYRFEPFIIKIVDTFGNIGLGEQHISPGSSFETKENGWNFLYEIGEKILKKNFLKSKQIILENAKKSPTASTAMFSAIENLENIDILNIKKKLKKILLLFLMQQVKIK